MSALRMLRLLSAIICVFAVVVQHVRACEPPPARVIPPGYNELPGFGVYKWVASMQTWPDASAICNADGAHLMIVNSQEEAFALVAAFGQTFNFFFHVGVHRINGGDNDFVTVLGGSLDDTGYTTWRYPPTGTYFSAPYVRYYSHLDEPETNDGLGVTPRDQIAYFICELP